MSFVLGIDGGTESLRALVFDLSGQPVGTGVSAYPTRFPAPGHAEQDPRDWWRAMGEAVPAALADAGLGPTDIQALAIDTTCCSVVALDDDGAPLWPALIWMDVRAAEEAAAVAASGDPALRVNGGGKGPVSAEWMIPKALWLSRHQPEIFAQASKIGEFQDFMTYHLTGRWVGSLDNAAIRWHWQVDHGGPATSLLAALGLSALLDKWPAQMLAPGTVIGGLTTAAATHLGLPEGLPVVQGGADAFIGMIGLGVTEPGDLALITGSSHLQLGVAARSVHAPGVWGTYQDAVYPGLPIIEGGQTSTGSIVNWFKRHFAEHTSYDDLNAAAAALPIGADGLMVLDHFQGNRTPYTDPLSRGAITGLSLSHTPAHVFRAILEGICLGTSLIVETFGEAFTAKRIVVAGGATRSPLWLQIHADTLGVPLTLTKVPDAPALGSAILAAVGAGAFPTIQAGCQAMVQVAETITPDPTAHAAYQALMPAYKAAYRAQTQIRELLP